jgi:hypothetical protein
VKKTGISVPSIYTHTHRTDLIYAIFVYTARVTLQSVGTARIRDWSQYLDRPVGLKVVMKSPRKHVKLKIYFYLSL